MPRSRPTAEPRGRATAVHFAQGLLMGGADVIPGVSGGTMALIVGIYERLIASLRAGSSAVAALLRGAPVAGRQRLGEVEWALVLPLGVGILVAIGVGAAVLPPLLETYPAQTSGLFFGLIAASVVVPWRRIRGPARPGGATARLVALAAVFAAVAFALVGLPERVVPAPGLGRVFASAAVAICAMILPGVSGAFLLLVLGVYEPTLGAVRALDLAYVATFVSGAAVGLGVFSKVLGWLLEHHHDRTMAALVGLMVGALRALWPWMDEQRGLLAPPGDAGHVLVVVALAVAGFVAVTLLVRAGAARAQRAAVVD